MRPQQQNRRMRGRNNNGGGNNNNNNNNRGGGGKGNQNPLTRSYESNGPDVKIRGNAQQIAEKYTTLARDAQSSGDRVMAENYLQHAEHYNRIIAAAQASMPIQNFQQNRDDFDDEDGEEFDGQQSNTEQGDVAATIDGAGPQPDIEGVPAEVALNGENGNQGDNRQRQRDNNHRNNRDGRDRNRNRDQNRNSNGDYQRRDFQPRDETRRDNQPEQDAQPQFTSAEADAGGGDSLPAFVTGGSPAPREEAAPRRSRRPRRGEQEARAENDAAQEAPIAEAGEVFATNED